MRNTPTTPPAQTDPTLFKPVIGLTIGDPAGVGPELVGRALVEPELTATATLLPIGDPAGHLPGIPTAEGAQVALDALEESVRLLKTGRINAVVTAPISKANMKAVGFPYPGHTEFYADRLGCHSFAMVLSSPQLTVAPVTIHLPLAKAVAALTTSEIHRVGGLLRDHLQLTGIEHPRIAVAGLNPHAGEEGTLGSEEKEIIAPAIDELRRNAGGAEFTGPHSPDTVFHRAVEGEFDAVLCMYHDQALIPLKIIGFHDGVNITAGLSHPRTSPDHGTAFQLAGKGAALPNSLFAAVRTAIAMAHSAHRRSVGISHS